MSINLCLIYFLPIRRFKCSFFYNTSLIGFLTLSILLGIFGTTLFDLVSVLYAATFPNPELAVGLASLITSLPYVFDFIVGYVSDRASNSFKAMKLVRWLADEFICLFWGD